MAEPTLQPAPSYDDFLARPLGRFVIDHQFMAWVASPSLIGYTMWGIPTERDVDHIARPLDFPHPPELQPRCNVLFDVRRVESVDFVAFERFLASTLRRLPELSRRIAKQAVVRPPGLVGAIAEGFGNLLMPSYGWRVVESTERGLAWLGESSMAAHVELLERAVDESRGSSVELARLRAWLAAQQGPASIDEAAWALGLSRRSLQRALAAAGSSYRAEWERDRVARALRYLRETDDKIETIALRLGFSSLSSFAAFFRRQTGQSPGMARGRRS